MSAVGLVVFRKAIERYMVYVPERELWTTPAAARLAFDDVSLTAADGVRLHGWHVKVAAPRALVLMFHGNGGNVADRVPCAAAFAREGLDTLLLDYRGYGRSEGEPSENGLYLDADAAFKWAEAWRLPVIIYGESLGGAVAVETAVRYQAAAVVLQSTFTSLAEMASRVVPLGNLLISQRFASIDKVQHLTAPTLVIHGDSDELIPHSMGERLFERIRAPKTMLTIPGAGHNDVFDRSGAEIAHTTARLISK